MDKFIQSYGILILAAIGVAQFWVKVLRDKFFRKGEIDYYETGTIVIGYNPQGPTIGLQGTLRASNKDVFVKSIDFLVVRERDKAQHIFKWVAFQSPKIDMTGNQPIPMELPSSFLISPNSPHRFHIIFNDNNLFEDIRPLLNEYYSNWYTTTQELNKVWPPFAGTYPPPDLRARQLKIIEDFRESQIYRDTYTALDRKCYWEPGHYQLIIDVRTSKPNKTFTKKYRFSITKVDSEILKLNVITILEEPVAGYLRMPNVPYKWAFSEYIAE